MSLEKTEEVISKIAMDPAASDWLKNALLSSMNRDPVDAANDAEVLFELLAMRANDALSAATKSMKQVGAALHG